MRLEKMNEEEKKQFMSKFSYEELEVISTFLFDLNDKIGMPQVENLIKDINKNCEGKVIDKKIALKYILKKFDYSELLTLKNLLDVYPDDKKFEKEKKYIESNIRNFEILAIQTQDFENLGFDLAIYYCNCLSPQLRNWYSDMCKTAEITPEDIYVYHKKINHEQAKINH